jgi:hypothetical protein
MGRNEVKLPPAERRRPPASIEWFANPPTFNARYSP